MKLSWLLTTTLILLLAGCSAGDQGGSAESDSTAAQEEGQDPERVNWNLRAPWGETRQDASRENKPPFKIFDNVYYVGLQTVCSYLITTSEGLVLIDSTFPETADTVLGNIRTLGFDPGEIEFIFITHAHPDHVGGAAGIKEMSGARVGMALGDWELVERQENSELARDLVFEDEATITLGDTTFTFYLTPGHTPGSTSIEYQVRDGENSYRVLAPGGLGMNMAPEVNATFLDSIERLKAMGPWEVMLPNHPWLMPGTLQDIENSLSTRGQGEHPGVLGAERIDEWFDAVITVVHQKMEADAAL